MISSIEDILELHDKKGRIEEAYIDMHFDDKILKLNTFTLKFMTVNAEREETRRWNNRLNFEIRKNLNLHKEIKEFRVLFEAFNKLKFKSGYIEKSERPDFILKKDGKTIGIEITKIYSGNDWVPEKIYEDIRTYNIDKKDVPGYIEYKKYANKITTYSCKENLIIKSKNNKVDESKLKVDVKNKILEKIRKLYEEYNQYDSNIILANVVSLKYFEDAKDIGKFNDELTFYINHLEENSGDNEYFLIMKVGEKWIRFDLKKHTCDIL